MPSYLSVCVCVSPPLSLSLSRGRGMVRRSAGRGLIRRWRRLRLRWLLWRNSSLAPTPPPPTTRRRRSSHNMPYVTNAVSSDQLAILSVARSLSGLLAISILSRRKPDQLSGTSSRTFTTRYRVSSTVSYRLFDQSSIILCCLCVWVD